MKVLLVEDDRLFAQEIAQALRHENFAVDIAANGEDGQHLGETEAYDAAVLDLGLPKINGAAVLRAWRKKGRHLPVLILTARDGWTDKVDGFKAGADDYLTKPVRIEELVMRLRALVRRSAGYAEPRITCGPLTFDAQTGVFELNGLPLRLTALEWRVLACLTLRKNVLVGAGVFIALALVAAALVIGFVLHRFIQGQIDQRLDTQIVFLSSMLTAGDDGVIAVAGNADGPPFDRAARGWYWEVVGPRNVLRSRSLEDASLDVPKFPRPPHEVRPAPADGPGPRNEALHFRIQQVTVGRNTATIIVSAPRIAVRGPLREAMTTLAISLAVLGLALVLAIVLQVRLGLRPLERLRQAVADVRTGRSERVPAEQPLEILPLVSELNGLLEQNAANLERARRHVANLAHGLKTPLATLAIALSERGRDATAELHSLVLLMERRIRHHLGRARAAALSGPTRAQTLIAPHIDDVGNVLGKIYADKRIALAQNVPRDLAVACEQQDFDEMVGNLLDNAFRWARNKVEIHALHDDGRTVSIVIEDDGPGLRQDQIPQVLRAGERIDESAPGFGFGLPITRELAELYGGELNLDPSVLGGLRVMLRLPLAV